MLESSHIVANRLPFILVWLITTLLDIIPIIENQKLMIQVKLIERKKIQNYSN